MVWLHVIVSATVLVVIGYFVAFAAQKASGLLARFGTYLSYFLYLLALAVIVLAVVFHHRMGGPGMMGASAGAMMHSASPAKSAPASNCSGKP